jgi:hypothetical protein
LAAQRSTGTGPNARPRNENIGQTAGGLPNDSSSPDFGIDDAEVERVRRKLTGGGRDPRDADQPGAAGPSQARADQDTYD